jgi:hypothetical protein
MRGEVAIFDLDGSEPYFHNSPDPRRGSVPDITYRNVDDLDVVSAHERSIADDLHRDLAEILRSDRKLFWQEGAVQEKLGMAAAKTKTAAVGAMRKGMKFLKAKGSMYLAGGEGGGIDGGGEDEPDEEGDADGGGGGGGGGSQSRWVGRGNYAYEGGFTNEKSEEDARIAFATFFVCLYGDVTTYLTQQSPGAPPVPDGQKFMKHRAQCGDLPGSGMFLLAANFLRSGMFDAFATARREEVMMRRPVPEDATLFALVTNRHRSSRIDYSPINVRHSARLIATRADFPGRYLIDWHNRVRERVLLLTSAQASYGGGDFAREVSQLAEDCRESGAILVDTMMVLWTRMQEGRGMQWKKAHLALQVLRGLLLDGPISAVTEAMDGLASVRVLKSYTETLRGQNARLVRDVASEIYSLLVDAPLLLARRRECTNARRLARDSRPSPSKKVGFREFQGFRKIHLAMRPAGSAVAPAPPAPVGDLLVRGVGGAVGAGVASNRADAADRPGGYSDDLLSMSVFAADPTPPHAAASANNAGFGGQLLLVPAGGPQPGNYSSDLLALSFGASPSPQASATSNEGSSGGRALVDPFSMHEMSLAATQSTGRQQSMSAGSSASANCTNDLFALNFGATSSHLVGTTTSNQGSAEVKALVDPFSMHEMSQATPRTGPPTAHIPPSNSTQSRSSPATPILAVVGNNHSIPPQPPMSNMVNSFPAQHPQHSQNVTSQSIMTAQTRPLPPMNSPLPVLNPMSIPPAQGWNHPASYHQPQQPWSNASPAFAPNGFQPNQTMQAQNNSAPVNPNGVPPVGYPMMTQGAHQFQQTAYSQASFMPPNPPM